MGFIQQQAVAQDQRRTRCGDQYKAGAPAKLTVYHATEQGREARCGGHGNHNESQGLCQQRAVIQVACHRSRQYRCSAHTGCLNHPGDHHGAQVGCASAEQAAKHKQRQTTENQRPTTVAVGKRSYQQLSDSKHQKEAAQRQRHVGRGGIQRCGHRREGGQNDGGRQCADSRQPG